METAWFAAGCFWGVEEAFARTKGVAGTSVGYMGGRADHPTYEAVCTGSTGHTETGRVEFNPAVVTFEGLLEVFWSNHDPTQLNRQGPDVGTQYRSAIFSGDEAQESAAKASMEQQARSGRFGRPIVTEIAPAGEFWLAEDYHQQYFAKQTRRVHGL